MRVNKHTQRKVIYILIAVMAGALYNPVQKIINEQKTLEASSVKFSKCTDGDTAHFVIEGKDETVRFLAVDTPETVKPNTPVQPYGKEASDYTCSLITNAESIRLEYEDEKTDKYGRVLAWIFVDEDLLQLKLIENGYAKVAYLYSNYKYTDKLENAQTIAKKDGKGVWSND